MSTKEKELNANRCETDEQFSFSLIKIDDFLFVFLCRRSVNLNKNKASRKKKTLVFLSPVSVVSAGTDKVFSIQFQKKSSSVRNFSTISIVEQILSFLFLQVAMEREIDDIQKVIGAKVYKIGHIQIYQRDRNFLNFIIIPISVGFVVFLFILTFVLRLIRFVI